MCLHESLHEMLSNSDRKINCLNEQNKKVRKVRKKHLITRNNRIRNWYASKEISKMKFGFELMIFSGGKLF